VEPIAELACQAVLVGLADGQRKTPATVVVEPLVTQVMAEMAPVQHVVAFVRLPVVMARVVVAAAAVLVVTCLIAHILAVVMLVIQQAELVAAELVCMGKVLTDLVELQQIDITIAEWRRVMAAQGEAMATGNRIQVKTRWLDLLRLRQILWPKMRSCHLLSGTCQSCQFGLVMLAQ